ncbi:MAG: AMIN domain-containing protein, partial [Acidobacteriota bacterium]
MKRKTYGLLFAVLSLLVFLPVIPHTSPSLATINKITAQPGKLNTRVVLETDSPLLPARTYYAAKAIVVEFNGVNASARPVIPAPDSPLVTGLRLEAAGAEQARLEIQVREPVPYSVSVQPNRTTVELNDIHRGTGEYQVEPEVLQQLEKGGSAAAFMHKLRVEEKDGEVHFRAALSEGIVSQVFTLENPLRLVVDVFNAVYEEPSSVLPVDKFGLKKARVAQFQLSNPRSITRLVFDLNEPKYYELRSSENEIVVSFFKNQNPVLAAAAGPVAQKPTTPPPPPQVASAPPQQEIPKSEIKAEEVSRQAKGDNGKNAKATTDSSGPAKPKPNQEPEPSREQTQEQRYQPKTIAEQQVKYTGEIITLKFKDADLRDVILFLGDFAKLNVVFDPEVRGVVTCNLEDVPWDQSLDILLKNNKLGKVLEGNVLRIAPISVLTREDEDQRRLRESRELAGPLIVKTIPLSYSKARDVMALLNARKSERGQITIDERTNTLIIADVKESHDLFEKLILVLDTPTPQVSIEARIVEATSTFIRNLGIQWGWRGIA